MTHRHFLSPTKQPPKETTKSGISRIRCHLHTCTQCHAHRSYFNPIQETQRMIFGTRFRQIIQTGFFAGNDEPHRIWHFKIKTGIHDHLNRKLNEETVQACNAILKKAPIPLGGLRYLKNEIPNTQEKGGNGATHRTHSLLVFIEFNMDKIMNIHCLSFLLFVPRSQNLWLAKCPNWSENKQHG